MTAETDELIQRLASDLAPVRPLPRPARRAAGWLVIAVVYLALLTLAMTGLEVRAAGGEGLFLLAQLVGVAAGVLAAFAAFASVVPGHSRTVLIWLAVLTGGWLAAFVLASFGAGEGRGALATNDEWVCVAVILLGGGPLAGGLAAMLRRGAPLNPALTAVLGALAVGLLANFSACIARPHAAGPASFVWHLGAIAALTLICIAGARLVLRWRR